MKDSACGRIVSQRKIESSLLREYDTKTTINISRINELKQKYNKNQTRTPLKGLINNTTEFSEFTNQIKQKYIATETNVMKQDVSTHINEYKRKANQTNNTINQKLNYIEEELNRWKNEKEAKQQKQLRQFKERQYVREALDIKISTSRHAQSKIQLPESMKVSMIENYPQTSVVQKMIDAKLDAKLHAGKKVDESDCKLLGEFKKQRVISKQFTIFINRLKDQISLDIDFTQIMLSLPVKDRNAVKQFIRHNYPSADVQFFTISPIEQDPLQTQAKVRYSGSIQSIGSKLHEFYVKIQEHFRLKLLRNFDLETIDTLFEEIGVKQMTLGHLISYINMRTGKQFRNRALVKLLRRLDICSHIIDRKQFTKGFVKL